MGSSCEAALVRLLLATSKPPPWMPAPCASLFTPQPPICSFNVAGPSTSTGHSSTRHTPAIHPCEVSSRPPSHPCPRACITRAEPTWAEALLDVGRHHAVGVDLAAQPALQAGGIWQDVASRSVCVGSQGGVKHMPAQPCIRAHALAHAPHPPGAVLRRSPRWRSRRAAPSATGSPRPG